MPAGAARPSRRGMHCFLAFAFQTQLYALLSRQGKNIYQPALFHSTWKDFFDLRHQFYVIAKRILLKSTILHQEVRSKSISLLQAASDGPPFQKGLEPSKSQRFFLPRRHWQLQGLDTSAVYRWSTCYSGGKQLTFGAWIQLPTSAVAE